MKELSDISIPCNECGKHFSRNSTLKQHSRIHKPKKNKCQFCTFATFSKSDLNKHERTHTRERPYICEICGEGYIQSSHLKEHKKTHSGGRPYKCEDCGRGFLKKGDMLRHRRIHTGELPYLCLICGRAFRQSAQCSNHVKNHHPDTVNEAIKKKQQKAQTQNNIIFSENNCHLNEEQDPKNTRKEEDSYSLLENNLREEFPLFWEQNYSKLNTLQQFDINYEFEPPDALSPKTQNQSQSHKEEFLFNTTNDDEKETNLFFSGVFDFSTAEGFGDDSSFT